MLQRIYGTAWPTQEELDDHLQQLEEAKRRDHRRLGRELDLFSVNEEIGPADPLAPEGRDDPLPVEEFEQKEQLARGYELVFTPHIASEKIYETSGHLEILQGEHVRPDGDRGSDYYLKPMNCPCHIMIYKSQLHSYRDLPVRSPSSARSTATSAPACCTACCACAASRRTTRTSSARRTRSIDEVEGVLDFAIDIWPTSSATSSRPIWRRGPKRRSASDEVWDTADERAATARWRRAVCAYKIDEGGGAFYGPKIDIKWVDALGREWQCRRSSSTSICRSGSTSTTSAKTASATAPVMIHRALLGSMERFFGVLIEHYAGAFPLWLAPVQAAIIPITDDQ